MWNKTTTGGWDDLRREASSKDIDKNNTKLNYDYASHGITFPETCTTSDEDSLHYIFQLPHSWQIGTPLKPHVHVVVDSSESIAWSVQYRAYSNGSNVPEEWTTLDTVTEAFTYTSGDFMQIFSLGEIDTTGLNVSAFVDIKLSRVGANDSYTGAPLFKEFDMHYRVDHGTIDEFGIDGNANY